MMAAFPLGLALAAALAYFIIPTYGWRAVFVVGVVPAVLLFFVRLYMPELVRYLLSRGRVDEAERTVAEIERRRRKASRSAAPSRCRPVCEERGVTVFELLDAGAAQAHHPPVDRVVLLPVVVERHHLHAADDPGAARLSADARSSSSCSCRRWRPSSATRRAAS